MHHPMRIVGIAEHMTFVLLLHLSTSVQLAADPFLDSAFVSVLGILMKRV